MCTGDKPQTETIATLRIDLIDREPPIWREIELPVARTLKQLHTVIQAAMECEDTHLREVCRSAPLFSAYLTPR